MPELPEVEVVRRGLDDHVRGRTIASAVIRHPRAVRRHIAGPEDLAARIVGATITGIARRGKYCWLILDDRDALLMHLGMSGQMLITPPDAAIAPHERARLAFTDGGSDLRFEDQRTFGHLLYDEGGAVLPSPIAHIARDPFDAQFDQAAAVGRIKTRRGGIKRALLDQTLLSGIGNIYADEALWAAKVHGETTASSLTKPRISAVIDAARDVMAAALAQGGTSFDSLYVDVSGSSGYFDRSLSVYGASLRALWHAHRAGEVHEPLEPLLPRLPTKAVVERPGRIATLRALPRWARASVAAALGAGPVPLVARHVDRKVLVPSKRS